MNKTRKPPASPDGRRMHVGRHGVSVMHFAPQSPGLPHWLETRGLRRLAHPELRVSVPGFMALAAVDLLRELAFRCSNDGERFEVGRRLRVLCMPARIADAPGCVEIMDAIEKGGVPC